MKYAWEIFHIFVLLHPEFQVHFFVVTFMSERSVLSKRRRIFCLANAFVHLQMIASSCWLNQHEVQNTLREIPTIPKKSFNWWTFQNWILRCKSALTAASGNVSFLALIKTGTLTNDSKISPTVIRCSWRRIYCVHLDKFHVSII